MVNLNKKTNVLNGEWLEEAVIRFRIYRLECFFFIFSLSLIRTPVLLVAIMRL